jgi:putative ABC transport system permease protein
MWLLRQRIPAHEQEFFIGDLVETFRAAATTRESERKARRRFWREALWVCVRRPRELQSMQAGIARGGPMKDLGMDIRLTIRRLYRTPGFTVAASLTLAIGMGAAVSIYSLARPALWGQLPLQRADRIVTLRERFPDGTTGRLGYTTIMDLGRASRSVAAVAAVSNWGPTLTEEGSAEPLLGSSVSHAFFDVMGVRPALGRVFLADEDRPGVPPSVILSHDLWLRRFGGDPNIVGRTIRLSEIEYPVVGILPANFEGLLESGIDVLRPLRYADTLSQACRSCRHVQAVARLRDGVSHAAARAELASTFERLRVEYPDEYGRNGFVVTSLRDKLTEGVRGALYALLGASALLLLIALANVANLHVARAVWRGSETAIRTALGASRWRLLRGSLLEGWLVALVGAAAGTGLAYAATRAIKAMAPFGLPRAAQVRVDLSVCVFALALSLLVGAACGFVPALVARGSVSRRLGAVSRTVARGGRDAIRRGLVIGEVSLALVLVGGAGILIQSVQRLLRVDVGFDTTNRVSMMLAVLGPRYADDAVVWQTWRAVHDAVRRVPGIRAVSLTSQLPMSSDFDGWGIHLESRQRNPAEAGDAFRFAVTPDYAATMGLRVLRGRFLQSGDDATSERVVVINEYMAQRDFGTRDPIGERLRIGGGDGAPMRTIVGVVSDVQHNGLDSGPSGQVYLPFDQNAFGDAFMRLVVHAAGEPMALMPELRRAIESVDNRIPVSQVSKLDALIESGAAQRRLAQRLFMLFGISALVLAAVGIFGVISGMVRERTREIGVRTALGASPSHILGHFLRQGLVLAVAGIAVGTGAALLLGASLRPLVYGISTRDPLTLGLVALVLGVVAMAATLLPAWRGSRLDPVMALRTE